jgi:hypothetical protein
VEPGGVSWYAKPMSGHDKGSTVERKKGALDEERGL